MLSVVLAVVLLGASPGTVLGSETTAGDWTLQQSFRGADADDPTPVLLTPNTPLQITAGDTVGVAMPHGDDLMS